MTEMDEHRARIVVSKAIGQEKPLIPVYYAIGGSHIYGFPSEEGSDIDLRGFHIHLPTEDYARLKQPDEQIIVNQGTTTRGYEDYEEIELVSYELRKFTSLVADANFNVLEILFGGIEVINTIPTELERLMFWTIQDMLPSRTHKAYLGMAKSNYQRYLQPHKEGYKPCAKKFLYVIRGLYASEFVLETEQIEPSIRNLAEKVEGGRPGLVSELIEYKTEREDMKVPKFLRDEAHDHINEKMNDMDELPDDDDDWDYRDEFDDWQMELRKAKS